jgi:hypothetical protein
MQQFHGPIYYGKHYEYMTLDSQEKMHGVNTVIRANPSLNTIFLEKDQ